MTRRVVGEILARWSGRARTSPWAVFLLAALLLLPLGAVGCAAPPQIVSISPGRGAGDVSTAEPITIVFDRAMDQRSVASHFRLDPASRGSVRWQNNQTLVFDHSPLRTSTDYKVILEGGYRDAAGAANSLRHHWSFRTEGPPVLTGSTPSGGDHGVDPSSYLALTFSRPMDLPSLTRALSIGPSVGFTLRADASDPRRVLIAPQALLYPDTSYSVVVGAYAKDVHGNPLPGGVAVGFSTGPPQPLKHWVTFLAASHPGQASDGVWIVNDTQFPRLLSPVQAISFSWSLDGSRLLLQGADRTWSVVSLDHGSPAPLPFKADWAGFLAGDQGYAYLDGDVLRILQADGQTVDVARNVRAAAVLPDGTRLAFAVSDESSSEIDAYDVALRTHYRLQAESDPIDQVAWSPDGQAIAYRLNASNPTQRQIRVRTFTGAGSTVTLGTGRVSSPAWQADSRHVFFQAVVGSLSAPVTRVFRRGLDQQAGPLVGAAAGMPSRNDLDVQSFSVSPDGREIAFIGATGGHTSVWSMNTDGTGVVELAGYDPRQFPYSSASLAWTPN